ncbi:EamA family transporter [Pseudomonas haemolytica]|uniref:EamA family transporter n=1 Tax=Pseudomonas haemolytica TaxID=2600065 RepID=A0A5P1D8T1_9PSED|nr:EamA family transporter [Pseudomonas haemolytica]MBJ2245081.1 EamA family transporter [Pseudomonas haemolytica]MBJ2272417.1 EamA family transporter [Pseudomonas haemolytica]MBK3446754.1 EamA family transporter [Pseudomonas haemolytica]MBK3458249.1 EamA family transporter [Pseudomonas haemolytica]MRJ20111.1 EamA family transporter [Pseudomonas haemolytica]
MDNSDIAITLVLISAFMHATWNAVVRAGSSRFMTLAMVDGTALLICLAALPLVHVPSLEVWGYVLVSVVLNTIYRLFLIKAYETGDFGQVYPVMRGVPPVLVALFSYFLLHEQLSFQAMAGVMMICMGIISLTFVRRMTAHMFKPILMAVCAGAFIAAYTVVDAKGVRASETVLQYIIYLTVFQSIPIPLLAFFKARPALTQAIRCHWRVGILGGVFYLASYGLVLFALSLDAVAKVSALRETSVIIGAIIAALFFHERFGWRRMLSAFVIVGGIILIKVSN